MSNVYLWKLRCIREVNVEAFITCHFNSRTSRLFAGRLRCTLQWANWLFCHLSLSRACPWAYELMTWWCDDDIVHCQTNGYSFLKWPVEAMQSLSSIKCSRQSKLCKWFFFHLICWILATKCAVSRHIRLLAYFTYDLQLKFVWRHKNISFCRRTNGFDRFYHFCSSFMFCCLRFTNSFRFNLFCSFVFEIIQYFLAFLVCY